MKRTIQKCYWREMLESDSRTQRTESWHLNFLANAFSYKAAKKHFYLQPQRQIKLLSKEQDNDPRLWDEQGDIDVCHDSHVYIRVACSTKTLLCGDVMSACCSTQVKMVKGRAIMSFCNFYAGRPADVTFLFSFAREISHLVIRSLLRC